ncbi:MAG: twin-arginine translocase subunit TatC [Kofleriaceae bacterium]|jgi:sec-independent protein translocase protein TatC|nr:twin-arginine translocase subunit TatC [Kofleriaceae bacterium]MBP6837661.1 twin-arginine translocase subunit TatC [Kofleriaceae bacterium]MBP9206960.1 twin-arginine translocase subunit TatC [Kofleriaceae bacterium]
MTADRPTAGSGSGGGEPAGDAELDAARMPFLEHLRELRDRVRNAVIAFFVAFVLCWYFADDIYAWLRAPLDDTWRSMADKLGPTPTMQFSSVTEPFWVYMSIGMWAGIFVASPLIFYQLWRFIAPGLYKREQQVGVWFSIASALFFCAGAAFCYYVVLDSMLHYFLGFADSSLKPLLSMREYLDFTRSMMLAFGAVFELPVLIFFLSAIGLVTHRGLWKFNRWFVVIAFVAAAILTPTPDAVTQAMMAIPMIVLYNLAIGVAWLNDRRRRRRDT